MRETKDKFKQLMTLKRAIQKDTQILADLRIQNEIKDNKDDIIKEKEKLLIDKIRECNKLQKEVVKFLDGIDNLFVEDILYFRYVQGFTWTQVAFKMGGGNTDDSVRKIAERYLRSLDT